MPEIRFRPGGITTYSALYRSEVQNPTPPGHRIIGLKATVHLLTLLTARLQIKFCKIFTK